MDLSIFEEEVKYKNNFLEQHGEHFINASISTLVLWQFGIINNEQLQRTFLSSLVLDFLRKHQKQILKQILPNFFL